MSRIIFLLILALLSACDTQVGDPIDTEAQRIELEEQQACERGECFCKTPLGNIAHGSKVTTYSRSSVPCDKGCAQYGSELVCDNGAFFSPLDSSTPVDIEGKNFKCFVEQCATCQLNGTIILSGESIDTYSSEQVGCRESCEDFKQRRTCNMGRLSGSDSYKFTSCSRKVCRCPLPDDSGYVTLDATIDLYSSRNAACGTTCLASMQTRTCAESGFGDNQTYRLTGTNFFRYKTCQEPSNCPCPLPGYGSIANNGSLTLYTKSVLGCGEEPGFYTSRFSCTNSTLYRNGELYNPQNADPIQYYTTYSIDCPGCALPWGGSVANGSSVTAYKVSGKVFSGCGQGCKQQERKCENGILGGDSSYDKRNCDNTCTEEGGGAPPRLCLLPWQNSFVTPDAQVPMYSKKRVGCGDSCQNYFKLARCNMETGTFDVPFNYMYQTCTEVCP